MHLSALPVLFTLLSVQVHGLPFTSRQAVPEKFVLPIPEDGPGPTFDATATRAATGTQIRSFAFPDICFDVSDFRAGDFRFNLVPLALKPCSTSVEGQKFDLITKGEHNNSPDGRRTLIVSSQQFTCVDRRSNGNDRARPGLFACGGRAAGDGETTADQQFFFTKSSSSGFTLVRDAVNNGIGPGNTCLSFNKDGFVSNTPCSPPDFTPEQTWIIDGSAGSPLPPTAPNASTIASEGTKTATPPTSRITPPKTSAVSTTLSTSVQPSSTAGLPEKFVLPKPNEGPGPTFDASATRAATNAHIRNAGSPNLCFDVSNFRAGDFRFNLVPVALQPCNVAVDGQKFDLITRGQHNNVQDGSRTLIVSTQQLTCVDRRSNANDRARPGLFACGGRAAGDGETTADQQYFFNRNASLAEGIGFPLARDAVNNGVGPGNQCLTLDKDGFLRNTPCAPPNFTPEQTWIVGDLVNEVAPTTSSTPQLSTGSADQPPQTKPGQSQPVSQSQPACTGATSTVFITTTVTVQPSPAVLPTGSSAIIPSPTATSSREIVSSSITIPSSAPSSTPKPEVFVLPKPADGPGPQFDATATRAATSVQIRNAASPNTCFDVSDFRAGDFRFNLVPLALKKCDSTVEGQKFDLITKGEHNNIQDGSRTIIVSSQQLTCVDRRSNIKDRARPGLFACGGRAAGDGETTADQQFFFNKAADLSEGIGFPLARDAVNNGVGQGNTCLTLNADGFLSNQPCSPPNFSPEQTWIVA